MSCSRLLVLILLTAFSAQAQVMNVRKWRQSERDSLDNALALVDEEYYLHALPIFENLLQSHPSEQFLQYSFAKCALQRGDKHHEAYDLLSPIYVKSKKIPDIQFDLALAAFYRQKFSETEELLTQYLANKKITVEGREKAERLGRYLRSAKVLLAQPASARVSPMGESVNSEGNEYMPSLRADQGVLAFNYSGPKSEGGLQYEDLGEDIRARVYREDIFISQKKDRRFSAARPIDSITTAGAEILCSMSPDGRRLLTYQDVGDGHGDIYLSAFNGTEYYDPQPLKGSVNGYSRESHACMSPDGKTLYFSSDRSGGFGGLDIYQATLAEDSSWTNIRNLGDSVNTSQDEDMPFLAADNTSLFFSSRGWNSMGGFDIFRIRKSGNDTVFAGRTNMGVPVNGMSDDIGFILTPDGRTGYFSSARKESAGMSDIFQAQFDPPLAAAPVYLARGKVSSGKRALAASLQVNLLSPSEKSYTTLHTDSISGEYMVLLPAGSLVRITCSAFSMISDSIEIDTRSLTAFREQAHNLELRAVSVEPLPVASANTSAPPSNTVGSATSANAAVTNTVASKPPTSAGMGPVSSTTVAWPDKDGFMPLTLLHKKTMRYLQRYGQISAPGLEFRVQFAAVKGKGNIYNPTLSKHGRIERLRLDDGYTRLTVGGSHATLAKAWSTNKKAVRAGQKESFVIALYNGRRVQFEELEKLGIFR